MYDTLVLEYLYLLKYMGKLMRFEFLGTLLLTKAQTVLIQRHLLATPFMARKTMLGRKGVVPSSIPAPPPRACEVERLGNELKWYRRTVEMNEIRA
jgi:hypothetical protein